MKTPPALNPAQAAEVAGVTRRTIYTWISDGTLPAHKVGPKMWRVYSDVLTAYLTGGSDAAHKAYDRIRARVLAVTTGERPAGRSASNTVAVVSPSKAMAFIAKKLATTPVEPVKPAAAGSVQQFMNIANARMDAEEKRERERVAARRATEAAAARNLAARAAGVDVSNPAPVQSLNALSAPNEPKVIAGEPATPKQQKNRPKQSGRKR